MSDQDFLKITINNILQELSEIKAMVSDGNEKLLDRVNDLETRVTILETKLTTTKNIFTHPWVAYVLLCIVSFIAGNFNTFLTFLGAFLK